MNQIQHINGHSLTRIARQRAKKRARNKRERDLARKIKSLPRKQYGVILADPEWRFEPYSRESGMDRAADNHYPTSPTSLIMRRNVKKIAGKDCVLFLWATIPMLPHAMQVMKAWGFAYKSSLVWVKDKIGLGYWSRSQHEYLLIGTRGKPVAPLQGTQGSSVIFARRTIHSAKPEAVAQMIEAWWPNVPKIELNRRGAARIGWDAWGAESGCCQSVSANGAAGGIL